MFGGQVGGSHAREQQIHANGTGDNVESAVAVHIRQLERRDSRRARRQPVRGKVLLAVVLVPGDGVTLRLVPEVDPTTDDDVQVTIVVEIAGGSRGRAVHAPDFVELEL